jgi:signal transduction protein with GAF and PtsI domain
VALFAQLFVMLQNVWSGRSLGARWMMTQLRKTARYSTLLEINRAAITQPGLDEIFQGTCDALKKVIPYDRMGLSLYAPEKAALKLTVADGLSAGSFYQLGLMFDSQMSHHGWVFQHQKPLVRRDLQREIEFQFEQPNVEEGIRSYCAVPLILRSESLGVLIVLSAERNGYSEAHAEFLQEVSDQFVLVVKSLMPTCPHHSRSRLVCPRCIASGGGKVTTARYKAHLSAWGKQGGRGRKKPTGSGFVDDIFG